jgi:L-alanine-DL-glutamate epimerase-like enolase superfamily enzyme
MKITRVRIYQTNQPNPHFNQSDRVVTVETDEGIVGIGEGGSLDSLQQCAGMLIGQDPLRIQHLWQLMYRGYFYPAGREKLHALGALDLALWDIKGKLLGAPLYELFGGLTRSFVECYSTGFPWQGTLGETAAACLQAGFRCFRTSVADAVQGIFNARRAVELTAARCEEIRRAIGPAGEWSIDFHTRLDLADAVRLCSLLEPLNPLLVEDPLRSENPAALANLRSMVKAPLAVGEQFGDRWDIHELIEQRLVDYARVTLPNTGGITELLKIAALAETHYIGLVPHFTGPIALAALVHVLVSQPLPVMMEIAGAAPQAPAYLPAGAQFKDGKLWPVNRPGIGVELDLAGLHQVGEVTQYIAPIPTYQRPDGSFTNW